MTSSAIDWEQLDDVIGGAEEDPATAAQFSSAWQAVVVASREELVAAGEKGEDEDLRRAAHRARGALSMWGLVKVCQLLEHVEFAPSPASAWRLLGGEALAELNAGCGLIEEHFPWMRGGTEAVG